MKKLLMIIGVVAIVASTQAASFSWGVAAGTGYAGYDVYLAKGNSYASLAALQGDLLGTAGNSGALAKATSTARSATASGTLDGLTAKASSSDPNINYDFYYVFVKGDDYWVSAKQTVSIGMETDAAPSLSLSQASGNAILGGDKAGSFAVPEPTSGLLLFLGMAGLALKRKRA